MTLTRKHRQFLSAGVLVCAIAAAILLRPGRHDDSAGSDVRTPQALPDLQLSPMPPGERSLVRSELQEALNLGRALSTQQRLDLLGEIDDELGPADCKVLLAAILQPRPVGFPPGPHSELFHQTAGLLQRSDDARETFARALATVARDAGRDPVTRDYALQHLRQVWDRASGQLRTDIETMFRDAAAADDASISSAALLSLHFLGTPAGRDFLRERTEGSATTEPSSYRIPDVDLEPMVERLLSEEPSVDRVTPRLAALRIVGDRGMDRFRNDLRRIAADASGEHAMVRMAAVSNIGRLGDSSDRAFLQSIDKSGDGRVANAVQRALMSLP
jgi:hypothetical protein